MKNFFPIFVLMLAMFSIQSGASLAKMLFPIVGSIGTTTLRLFFATLILGLFWRPWRTTILRKEIKLLVYYGMSLGFMNFLFYLAIERIPLGIAVAIEFIGPLTLAVMSSKKLLDYLWALLAAIGILLILPIAELSSPIDPVGILFAFGAAICWALYIISGQKAGKHLSAGVVTSYGMLIATICVLPFGIISSGPALLNFSLLPLALGVALFSSAIPYSLEMYALKNMPRKEFGILMSLEPAFAAMSGFFFLHESLNIVQWMAIVLIMVSSVGVSLTQGGSK